MHSTPIIVESMSATSNCLRRPASPWTTTSTPANRPSSARRAVPGSIEKSRSQALPSSIHERPKAWTPASRSASSAAEISPLASRSAAIRVAMNMKARSSSLPPLALIAGPTASGKSALALALAEQAGGIIVNADSAQVYRDIPVLSAAPTADETGRAEHRLYGVLDGALPCSAAEWAEMAKREIVDVHASGQMPILVGGTGLYIRTLLDGIAPVPAIDPEVRAKVRETATDENREKLEVLDP